MISSLSVDGAVPPQSLSFLGRMTLFYLSDLDDLTVNAGGTGLV